MGDGRSRAIRATLVTLLAAAGAGGFVLLLPHIGQEVVPPEDRPRVAGSERPRSPSSGARPGRPEIEIPEVPADDLWAMAPSEAGMEEIVAEEFRLLGGYRTPGTDPAGARREVSRQGWAERFERELRTGLEETIAFGGARLDRVECRRGRCLVELSYDSMNTALARTEAIGQWMTDEVRCSAFTEGPDEGESPAVRPQQQVWILCGEPDPHRRRSAPTP